MFLGSTLSSATSGLDSIERQLAVLSQNISNASTPNYTVRDGSTHEPGIRRVDPRVCDW